MYVYKITIIPTQQYYYGSRCNKKSLPSELGTTYFTSSPIVQNLIFEYGKNNVKFDILEIFNDKQKCLAEEYKHISIHKNNDLCLNRQGDKNFSKAISKAHKNGSYDRRNINLSIKAKERWKDSAYKAEMLKKLTGRTWTLDPEKASKVSKNITAEHRKLGTKAVINSIWINNGIKSKRIKKDDMIPPGFKLGRAEPAWNKKTK